MDERQSNDGGGGSPAMGCWEKPRPLKEATVPFAVGRHEGRRVVAISRIAKTTRAAIGPTLNWIAGKISAGSGRCVACLKYFPSMPMVPPPFAGKRVACRSNRMITFHNSAIPLSPAYDSFPRNCGMLRKLLDRTYAVLRELATRHNRWL